MNRFLTAPAIPSKPVPRSNILAGSGTALPVICPWTVVIPLFDAGGTRFNGLLVIEYVTPPIVIELTVKVTTPEPELDAENDPVKVAEKLSLPGVGTVWVIVRVNVPENAAPLPLTKVWKLPKLEPVGVSKLVDPRPVKVSNTALPKPPLNVTALVPLPVQPPQVKIPEVLNVTGSAFAVEAPIAMKPATTTVITIVFIKRAMLFYFPSQDLIRHSRTSSNLVVENPLTVSRQTALLWT
jgi:hypothetical protein